MKNGKLESAIEKTLDEFGLNVLNQPQKLSSVLFDLTHGEIKYWKQTQIILEDPKFLSFFASLKGNKEEDLIRARDNAYQYLIDANPWDSNWIEMICDSFTAAVRRYNGGEKSSSKTGSEKTRKSKTVSRNTSEKSKGKQRSVDWTDFRASVEASDSTVSTSGRKPRANTSEKRSGVADSRAENPVLPPKHKNAVFSEDTNDKRNTDEVYVPGDKNQYAANLRKMIAVTVIYLALIYFYYRVIVLHYDSFYSAADLVVIAGLILYNIIILLRRKSDLLDVLAAIEFSLFAVVASFFIGAVPVYMDKHFLLNFLQVVFMFAGPIGVGVMCGGLIEDKRSRNNGKAESSPIPSGLFFVINILALSLFFWGTEQRIPIWLLLGGLAVFDVIIIKLDDFPVLKMAAVLISFASAYAVLYTAVESILAMVDIQEELKSALSVGAMLTIIPGLAYEYMVGLKNLFSKTITR